MNAKFRYKITSAIILAFFLPSLLLGFFYYCIQSGFKNGMAIAEQFLWDTDIS